MKYPYGKGIVKWISTDWLLDHIENNDMMILDVQPNVHDYILEHIPGAIYMNEGLLRAPLRGIPANYVPPESIHPVLFARIGLKQNIPVVVYSGTGAFTGLGDGLEQTMMAYSLARFGKHSIYVLDGGLDKWREECKPLTKEFPKVTPSDFDVRIQHEYFLNYEEFKSIKDNESVILLDARPSVLYEGQGPWMKPGHIPGAINLPWTTLMDIKNKRLLKPIEEIKSTIEARNISSDNKIICSCGTGREATNEFLLFKWYLGYPDVKIYEGSFTEWSSYPENPTVVGKDPR